MTNDKERILIALENFVSQRPGLEPGNYSDWRSYRSEAAGVTRDRHHFDRLCRYVAMHESITADMLRVAFCAFSGRLTLTETDGKTRLDYCTGQYFPTEYRKAACAVLASAIWDWTREHCMPAPSGVKLTRSCGEFSAQHDNIDGLTPGDWLRRHFRREFGAHLAGKYFN